MRIETRRRLGPDHAGAVAALLDAAARADGRRAIDANDWTDVTEDGRDRLAALVGWASERPVAYAQVSYLRDRWSVAYVVDPSERLPGCTAGEDIVAAAVDVIRGEGGGVVQMWLSQPRPDEERAAAANGLRAERSLYQVRRPLPVETGITGAGPPLTTRPFRPGVDEGAWLEVNNRAFAWHPEQGGWDLGTLAAREAEPWFDPDGFLLHEGAGHLDGFCWTRVHRDTDPVQGEIYVIAVDPGAGGRGLGRRLTLAGLDHLAGRGITVGMLYVDATNTGAVKLYIDLGFVVHHVDRAYTATREAW